MKESTPTCANCPIQASERLCQKETGRAPDFCPTLNKSELIKKSVAAYQDYEDIYRFAQNASIQESEGYANREKGYAQVRPCKSRIEEIMEFAEKMDYKRLGLAFCIGLRKESRVVEKIISSKGFEVVSAVCKVGRVPKQAIGITFDQQIVTNCPETMCNPILQAMVLNDENTEFNILLGLCVGHDSLFLKNSNAPCTVLAVKDRMLGHNPLAAIYNIDSYYRSLK